MVMSLPTLVEKRMMMCGTHPPVKAMISYREPIHETFHHSYRSLTQLICIKSSYRVIPFRGPNLHQALRTSVRSLSHAYIILFRPL